MPSRVRQYNAAQAYYISSQILASSSNQPAASAAATHCTACGTPLDSTVAFCTHCGTTVTHSGLTTQPAL
jgi:hypothetical protein